MRRKRDKASKILERHVCKDDIDSLSKNVWDDIVDAMIEYGGKRSKSSERASRQISKLNEL